MSPAHTLRVADHLFFAVFYGIGRNRGRQRHGRTALSVAVVDPATGGPLGEDRVGEVWVSGPSVAPG